MNIEELTNNSQRIAAKLMCIKQELQIGNRPFEVG